MQGPEDRKLIADPDPAVTLTFPLLHPGQLCLLPDRERKEERSRDDVPLCLLPGTLSPDRELAFSRASNDALQRSMRIHRMCEILRDIPHPGGV